MFKPATLFIVLIIFISGYWFYSNMTTPQGGSRVRVSNLPWQITVVDPQTLHVFDLNIGKDTLGQADKILLSEYELAWFENEDQSISLEAYFLRVNLSGLRARIVLELDSSDLDINYLKKHSGKPEILKSHAIKYPLDDLAHVMSDKVIKSLTYIPKSSVDAEMLKSRFGQAQKVINADENTEFWLYPDKGLVIMLNHRGKEAFQYIPLADFQRLKKSVMSTFKKSSQN
ncbi:MAG: hypothetical protein KZQ83_04595 [gamma proteobacterium symbiont of Taylorina sp.]|nr:hypothetical protein [gamma proteobacterium symbiont of Taylorina sp.]